MELEVPGPRLLGTLRGPHITTGNLHSNNDNSNENYKKKVKLAFKNGTVQLFAKQLQHDMYIWQIQENVNIQLGIFLSLADCECCPYKFSSWIKNVVWPQQKKKWMSCNNHKVV